MRTKAKCASVASLPELMTLLGGRRFEILVALAGVAYDVSTLADGLDLSNKDVSKCLIQLRKAGLLAVEHQKTRRIYSHSDVLDIHIEKTMVAISCETADGDRFHCKTRMIHMLNKECVSLHAVGSEIEFKPSIKHKQLN